MKRLAIAVVLVACGGKSSHKDDGGNHLDSTSSVDAPRPLQCLSGAVSGGVDMITMRQLPDAVDGGATLATGPLNDQRLFVVEQQGRIRLYKNEALVQKPFLDIQNLVSAGGELGLLGLAFHPQYATNGKFYVWYTAINPGSDGSGFPYADVLAQYTVSSDPDVATPTATILLSIPDPFSNHNGGMLNFGPDGDLYVGTGDGGDGGDPKRNGQNPNALLGKILRIDVDHPASGKPYGIPSDNPFADGTAGAPEVFMLGVRNPWRWSFDAMTGDMWIGDVGQNITEEVDVLRPAQQKGANLGWSMYEASACCETQSDKCAQSAPQQDCVMDGKFFPQNERPHSTGWNAIIGGQVYRGTCYPDIAGTYFYTDNGHGGMSTAIFNTDNSLTVTDLGGTWPASPAALHADGLGELWEVTTAGKVYHLEVMPAGGFAE
ncbi:MAG TPA: PQQ-dependent sugar dehydrogenase [Kofleriaceae bacterium]|jgi:glucose/arabinose dehydrogenase